MFFHFTGNFLFFFGLLCFFFKNQKKILSFQDEIVAGGFVFVGGGGGMFWLLSPRCHSHCLCWFVFLSFSFFVVYFFLLVCLF